MSAGNNKCANNRYVLFFDGCSKGNPGKAGAGAVLYREGLDEELWSQAKFVGNKETNNYAEYMGLILGLEEVVSRPDVTHLLVKGDSLLVIKQMQGVYQVKAPNLIPLYQRATGLVKQLPSVEFQHVYRLANKRADVLSNAALLL